MSIEELMEKTTIEFPRPLTLDEAEKLLEYIAEQLPGNVNHHTSYFKSIFYRPNEEMLKEEGTVDISVNIVSFKDLTAIDSFKFKQSKDDITKLSAIRFLLVPGWDLSDYRSEIKQLWDDTREIVMQYFKQE